MIDDDQILEGVLNEFKKLAAIPRASKHEQVVGRYLIKRLKTLGLDVRQDSSGNVIADMRGSAGYRKAPRTILQAHMDMVCVADEGVKYNPLTDSIKLHRSNEYLWAEGTSLGADDGIGIAIILYIIKTFDDQPGIDHGPIRAIFTVDEEAGMSGANNLDKEFLTDAQFLINCDSENCDELVIGSAGSVHVDFMRRLERVVSTTNRAVHLAVSGLCGGHSGEEINSGRANAIKLLIDLIGEIKSSGNVELVDIKGGKAVNAIADHAAATIMTELDTQALKDICSRMTERTRRIYKDVEPDVTFNVKEVAAPNEVMSSVDLDRLMAMVMILHSGVFAMSRAVDNLVETSANLGIVNVEGDHLVIKYFPRSSVNEKLEDIVAMCKALGDLAGFDVNASRPSAAWTENRGSRLAEIMQSIFNEQNDRPMIVKTIHAGLETSYFFEKNPQLDIVSVGTTNENIHSPRERLKLDTVPIQVKLIAATLTELTKNI